MKFSDVTRYVDGAIELQLATVQRRVSLVGGDEVSRIGEVAFVGPDAEDLQELIDFEVARSVALTVHPERPLDAADAQGSLDELAELSCLEEAEQIRDYAVSAGRKIAELARRAEPHSSEDNRSAPDDRVPMFYAGTWRDDATYRRGDTVTRSGLMWHCNMDHTTETPGHNRSWTMTHKSHGKHDKPSEAA